MNDFCDRDHKSAFLKSPGLRFASLLEAGAEPVGERSPDILLERFCRATREMLSCRYVGAAIVDATGGLARFGDCGLGEASAQVGAQMHASGIVSRVMREQWPETVRGSPIDATLVGPAHPPTGTLLVAPMSVPGRHVGWLYAAERVGEGAFTEDDLHIAATIALQLAAAWTNLALREEVAGYVGRLEKEMESREKALAALVESRERLAGLVDSAMDAIISVDERQRIRLFNPAAEQMFGYTAEEIVGQPLGILMPEADRAKHHGDVARYGNDGVTGRKMGHLMPVRGRRKDGRQFPLEASISRHAADGGRMMTAILRDMSEGVRAQEQLQESELRFRQLAENIRKVFYLVDPLGGKIIYVSPAFDEVWGRPREELYRDREVFIRTVVAEDRHLLPGAQQPEMARKPYDIEYRISRPDGERRLIRDRGWPVPNADGKSYRVAGIAEDITEARRMEEELRESDRRFRDVLSNVELLAVMVDTDGRILYCNDFFLRLAGWDRGDVEGQNWCRIFGGEQERGKEETLARLASDDLSVRHYRGEIVTRSGETRTIQWNDSILRSGEGRVIGVASLGEDVTDRIRAEEQARLFAIDLERAVLERTAELAAANKELQAFDYSISHDLRAPVRRIQGFAAALGKELGPEINAQAKDHLHRIAMAAETMDQLIADLFSLSTVTQDDLQRTRIDIGRLATDIVAHLRRAHPDRQLELVAATGLLPRGDPGLVRILMENLIDNAWKFSAAKERARIEIGCEYRDGERIFFVRDDGAGFEMALAARLFTPFRRLHSREQFEGTGIGLATVKRIVLRHGGRVWADSAPGRGATFFFTLQPRTAPP